MLRDLLARIPYLNYTGHAVAFLAAFLETLPGLGLFIPGQSLVLLCGFLAQQQVLVPWIVLLAAIAGAVLGDLVAFGFGRRYGVKLFPEEKGVVRGILRILRAHPIKALILSRFNPITRAFGPFAAGTGGIKRSTFLFADVIGGILWGCLWVGAGYLFGASYDLASSRIDRYLIFGFFICAVVVAAYYYLKHQRLVERRTSILLFVNLVSLAVWSAILFSVRRGGLVSRVDSLVAGQMPLLQHAGLTAFMEALDIMTGAVGFSILTVLVAAALVWHQRRRNAVLFSLLMLGAILLNGVIKELVARPRPEGGLLTLTSFSFASGHALLSAVFCAGVVVFYGRYVRRRTLLLPAAVLAMLLIGFARLYLGVHWLSDVIGGYAIGLCWFTFVLLIDEAYRSYRNDRKKRLYRA